MPKGARGLGDGNKKMVEVQKIYVFLVIEKKKKKKEEGRQFSNNSYLYF